MVKTSETKSPEEKAAEQEKLNQDLRVWVHDLVYHNCAFQYWYYVEASKQSTELTPDKLDEALDSERESVRATGRAIMDGLKVKMNYVEAISKPAKQSIFDEINSMPSKSYRHENGIGKVDDMKKRCEAIAHRWDISMKGDEVNPVTSGKQPDAPVGGGGIKGGKRGSRASAHNDNPASSVPTGGGKAAPKAHTPKAAARKTPTGKMPAPVPDSSGLNNYMQQTGQSPR